MSIYLTVKEHLVINDTSACPSVAGAATLRIARLSSFRNNRLSLLNLTADGVSYSLSAQEDTALFQSIINAMKTAGTIDMVVEYGMSDDPDFGPDSMCRLMESVFSENPSLRDNIFCSIYVEADCGEGNGLLYAYGAKNGRQYMGRVEYADADTLPENGVWQTEAAAVSLAIDNPEGYDMEAIDRVCVELWKSFSNGDVCALVLEGGRFTMAEKAAADTFIARDGSIEFHLENAQLRSADDFRKLIRLYNELNELTEGECGYLLEFADWSGDDVRLITLDFDEKGECQIRLAEI